MGSFRAKLLQTQDHRAQRLVRHPASGDVARGARFIVCQLSCLLSLVFVKFLYDSER